MKIPYDFPCGSDDFRSPRPTEIDAYVAFLSRGKEKELACCEIRWAGRMWPNFWQKLTFFRCSNCDILDFAARRRLPLTTMAFFLNTQHARNCFFLGREKNGHSTISWLVAAMHDSATMRPFHEIIDCTTYIPRTTDVRNRTEFLQVLLLENYHKGGRYGDGETMLK
jgi:hypothetical protein